MSGDLKQAMSQHFRGQRDELLRAHIAACPRQGERLQILDVGGRSAYWQRLGYDFLAKQNAHVTLLNLAQNELTADADAPRGMLEMAVGNGCALEFADKSFDLCHSNSVIEHVGLWRDMEAFARETRRVAQSYYVQTPNYWFPIEPHFPKFPANHWLPRPWRAGLMRALKLATTGKARDLGQAYAFVDGARLLTRGQMRYLFPEAKLTSERVLFLAKSFIATHIGSPSSSNLASSNREFSHG